MKMEPKTSMIEKFRNASPVTPSRSYLALALVISLGGILQLVFWHFFLPDTLLLIGGVILTGFGFALAVATIRPVNAAKGKTPSRGQAKGVQPPVVEDIKVLTEIKCRNCSDVEIRDFKRGDFVFKMMPKCPKCANERYISSIFSLPPENEDEKKFDEDV
jgi:hypothetical protein